MKKIWLLLVALALVDCTITQKVTPVASIDSKEVCIIENPKVRDSFLQEYQGSLNDKGIKVKLLKQDASINECEFVSTYLARWSWDLALYMSYAEIKVYHNTQLEGEALYDSTKGSANMGKFVDAAEKIRELVDHLFP